MSVESILDVIAPEFATDPDKSTFISLAMLQTSETVFGTRYNLATALRTAHMMTLRDRGGDSGTVTSRKEGDLALSYSSVSDDGNPLKATSYGLQLLDLMNQNIVKVSVGGVQILPND